MIQTNRASIWFPDYLAGSILEIASDRLKLAGVTHIVFDLDKTLARRRKDELAPKYADFIAELKRAGFTILIGSNTRRDISWLLKALDTTAVRPIGVSSKPRQSFYRRIVTQADTAPRHIAMVGDNIVNDVIGANRAGFTTILVSPLQSRKSFIFRAYARYCAKR